MTTVHLRSITVENFAECINLRLEDTQEHLVASNMKSLAEAKVNPDLYPYAIYDGIAIGYASPQVPMVGFIMYELTAGVGFVERLMIDHRYQHKGYGRAAMLEVIRRLRLLPSVQLIATSHKMGNEIASNLYQSLGFIAWETEWAKLNPSEVFLMLG